MNQLTKPRHRCTSVIRLLFGLWASVWATVVSGQDPYSFCQPELIHFSRQTYGADNQNWSIVQHPKTRFVYAANSKGLLEYDGSRWRLYELPRRQVVRSVAIDPQGHIYTGAQGEFGYWLPNDQGQLTYHSLRGLVREPAFRNEEIWHILPTKQGVLFQSFAYMYRYQQGRVQRLIPPGNMLFVQAVRDRLLLGVLGKGIYELRDNQFTLLPDSEFLGRETVNTLLPIDETGVLIGTERAVYRFDGVRFQPFNAQLNTLLQQNGLNRGIRLSTGLYAFGTLRDGVFVTRPDGQITDHISQKNGLQNSTVLALRQDADNNLWVGLDKGIDLINLNSPVRYFTDTEGTLGTVYNIARLGSTLYMGTNQGVYARSLTQPPSTFQLVAGTQGQVWDLAVIDNQLLCGHNRGTFRIDGMRASLISAITGGWTIKPLQHHPDYLIQGTYTRLCLYKKDGRGRWAFSDTIAGFSGSARQVLEDNNGHLWVNRVDDRRIQRLRLSPDLRTVLTTKTYFPGSALPPDTRIYSIQDEVVVNSSRGLQVYQNGTDRFADVATRLPWLPANSRALFPLPDAGVLALQPDRSLHWARPNAAPRRVAIETDQWVENYEKPVALDSTHLALCRETGFELLPRSALASLSTQVPVAPLIRQVSSLGDTIETTMFQPTAPVPALSFSHRQNTIRIDVCTPLFTQPVRYRYWLENSVPDWSAFESFQQKEFSGLAPGQYVFHVRSDQYPAEQTFAFTIRPPWYWATWSKLLYSLLLAGLIWLLYRLHLRRVALRQNEMREKMEEKLRFQEEHSQREIVTLQKEQLEQGLIQKSEELANSTMQLIRKNELLVQLKTELSHLREHPGGRAVASNFQRINTLIDTNISTEQDWKLFETNFNRVHEEFLRHLIDNYPDLSQGDLKLAAYLRMNLSTKEIAQLLNITQRSVELKRYRLRKKLDLDTDINLSEFMIKY